MVDGARKPLGASGAQTGVFAPTLSSVHWREGSWPCISLLI